MGGRLGSAAARTEAELLASFRALGMPVSRVVLTRNTRVMASLTGRGTTLRLHGDFATAPVEVLRSLAYLFVPRERMNRSEARRIVRAFLASRVTLPPVPRTRRVPAGDREHLRRLLAEFDRINADLFGGVLPRVPLFLSGRMTRRNGHFRACPPEIVLARRLCTHAAPGEAERTLRHEMIHLWQHATGAPLGHGAEFRRWARALGITPRATRSVCWAGGEVHGKAYGGTPVD